MLRASSQGLSLALPTLTRATLQWQGANSTRRSMSALRIQRASTSTPRHDAGNVEHPKRDHVGSTSARALAPPRLGPAGAVQPLSPQESALATSESGKSGSGLKRQQGREKDGPSARPVRFLRSSYPRFCHPRFEKLQKYLPHPREHISFIHPDAREPPVFLQQTGYVNPRYWDPQVIDPILRAIDDASRHRNFPSPSPTIRRLLKRISEGRSLQHVWDSYVELKHLQSTHPIVADIFPPSRTPSRLLWRLFYFISYSKPVTTHHYPRLLMLLQHLWDMQKYPALREWNMLMRLAADGQRGGGEAILQRCLGILNDYIQNARPGTTKGRELDMSSVLDRSSPNQPDIYTYTILIHVATMTKNPAHVRDAISLLEKSGLQPTLVTHLTILNHCARTHDTSGMRDILRKIEASNMQLGVDGINTCIWAFALNGELELALAIYRVLRHQVRPDSDPSTVTQLKERLRREHNINLADDVKPDHRTYVALIQAMSYHAQFNDAFAVFADFLDTHHRQRLSPTTGPAFRALFLGFSKFAVGRLELAVNRNHPHAQWNLANLRKVYRLFLKMPRDVVPSKSTIYWIMTSFDQAADHDIEVSREVWQELEERYKPIAPSLFNQARLRRIRAILFPPGPD